MRLPVISLCFHSIVPFFARSIVSTAGRSVVTIDNNNIKVPGNGIVSWLPPLLRIVRVCFCFCILYAFEIYGDPIFGCCINKQWQSSDVMHIQTKCFCWRWVLQIRREMRAYDNPIFSFLIFFSTICHANSFARIVLYLHRHFNPVRCFIILFRTTCKMISRIPWQHHRRRWRREITYSCAASIAPVVTVARFEKQPRNLKIKGNADKTRLWVNSVFYISDE